MFEIMTDGNNPYSECNSPAEIILKVAEGISPNVDTSWPLAEIMQNCFACHPDNRYLSFQKDTIIKITWSEILNFRKIKCRFFNAHKNHRFLHQLFLDFNSIWVGKLEP